MRRGSGDRRQQCGFTLLELMIVITILGIVASIGVPLYGSALRTARIGKARHELITIARAVDLFKTSHDGVLPLTLYLVGHGGRLDPWGLPYCFLNLVDGTGDGLQWAVADGLVDACALGAFGDDGQACLSRDIRRLLSVPERSALVSAVARHGNFSFFTAVDVEATRRRDGHTMPVATDYDLFSLGPDGRTATLVDSGAAADDVIRASNGAFIGLVSEY